MPRLPLRHAVVLLAVALGLAADGARVQAQATGLGPALKGHDFNLDLVTGPVIGSGRVVSLGGAYTALALGADGAAWTPAAYATRSLWEQSWFDWDLAFDYNPSLFNDTDFDNNGRNAVKYQNMFFSTLGGRFEFGEFGFGGLVRLQDYNVGPRASLSFFTANYGAAYALLHGQLMVGLAARTSLLTISDRSSGESLVEFGGTGPEAGAVLGLEGQPYRIGIAARLAVVSSQTGSARVAAGLTLPRKLVLPAELQIGFAYQLGARPLNRKFVNPHDVEKTLRAEMLERRGERLHDEALREEEARQLRASVETGPPRGGGVLAADPDALPAPRDSEWWAEETRLRATEERELRGTLRSAAADREAEVVGLPRQYLLLSADVIFIGATDNGVGIESFLTQDRQVSGDNLSVGARFGAEGEPIEGHWKVRLGTYLEPSRVAGVNVRVHGTVGTDVRLFRWDVFGIVDPFDVRIGASLDIAARYNNFGFGLGIWH